MNSMKSFLVIFLVLLCGACHVVRPSRLVGTYGSRCVVYDCVSDLIVQFNPDSTFVYYMYLVDEIKGKWHICNDTVILYSNKFPPPGRKFPDHLDSVVLAKILDSSDTTYLPVGEYNKYTDLDNRDAFLIKGKKLYAINKLGMRKSCPLLKLKKKGSACSLDRRGKTFVIVDGKKHYIKYH